MRHDPASGAIIIASQPQDAMAQAAHNRGTGRWHSTPQLMLSPVAEG
jgi:hypothetical protein